MVLVPDTRCLYQSNLTMLKTNREIVITGYSILKIIKIIIITCPLFKYSISGSGHSLILLNNGLAFYVINDCIL